MEQAHYLHSLPSEARHYPSEYPARVGEGPYRTSTRSEFTRALHVTSPP